MKNSIHRLAATAVIAAFFTTTAQAGVRQVNHGRAGYVAVPESKAQSAKQEVPRETTIALVIEKPDQGTSKLQPMGRAGYRYVTTQKRTY